MRESYRDLIAVLDLQHCFQWSNSFRDIKGIDTTAFDSRQIYIMSQYYILQYYVAPLLVDKKLLKCVFTVTIQSSES